MMYIVEVIVLLLFLLIGLVMGGLCLWVMALIVTEFMNERP